VAFHSITIRLWTRTGRFPKIAVSYIAKFAADIIETAEKEYHIRPTLVDLESWSDAQAAPTPYAVFALIYGGRLLADHQISRTRFRNIMDKSGT